MNNQKQFTIDEVRDVYSHAFQTNARSVQEIMQHSSASTRGMFVSMRCRGGDVIGRQGYITADDLLMCLAAAALDCVKENNGYHKSRMGLYKDMYDVLLGGTMSKRKLRTKAIQRIAKLLGNDKKTANALKFAA